VNFRRNGAAAEKTLRLQYLITILSYLVDEDKFARDIHSSGCVYLNKLAAGGEAIPLAIRVRASFPFRNWSKTHECCWSTVISGSLTLPRILRCDFLW
jgi:hypothetical protein